MNGSRTKPTRSLHELEEERVVPWGDAGHFAWHRARYEFALAFVEGARVLDVGSGEGYGSALLAQRAASVVGVDYSPVAVAHAGREYRMSNVSFSVAEATNLRADLNGFDVVVCFEVIEHIADAAALVHSLRGALRPGGMLVLSTPNRLVDLLFERVSGRETYEYHINLLAPAELRQLLKPDFARVRMYGQSIRRSSLHSTLKTLDALNLRHRIVRSAPAQKAIANAMGSPPTGRTPEFRFSRLLVRQSPHVVLIGRA